MVRQKVIIDTDPGVDDILALLYALASPQLQVLAITTVHGNIDLTNTTRNTISLFNVLYAAYTAGDSAPWIASLFKRDRKITLAAGAKTPLVREAQLDAAYFHGRDGLGGVSEVYPEYLPASGWESAFPSLQSQDTESAESDQIHGLLPSSRAAHEEILSILGQEEPDSVSIVALGPLTNLSHALTLDSATFARAKDVVVMGGALRVAGNVTPTSEFNFMADAEAASHLLSFTSPSPSSTHSSSPDAVARKVNVTMVPLDTTTSVTLSHDAWNRPGGSGGGGGTTGQESVLKAWCNVFVNKTFANAETLYKDTSIEKVNLSMHDPSCIWYLLRDTASGAQQWRVEEDVDVRVECTGTWTRGACVIDDRGRERILEGVEERAGSDQGGWLHRRKGNRVSVVTKTPGSDVFVRDAMGAIFGSEYKLMSV